MKSGCYFWWVNSGRSHQPSRHLLFMVFITLFTSMTHLIISPWSATVIVANETHHSGESKPGKPKTKVESNLRRTGNINQSQSVFQEASPETDQIPTQILSRSSKNSIKNLIHGKHFHEKNNVSNNVWVVTRTNDAGDYSLRWAIHQANLNPGPDTILFDIPKTNSGFNGIIWTISPKSRLPELSDSGTVIDGFSQTENWGETNIEGPEILLDGTDTGFFTSGLTISSSENVISGFIISGFYYYGIHLKGELAQRNLIFGNYLGNHPSDNDTLNNHDGIYLEEGANHNIIGINDSFRRNVISGNQESGATIKSDSNVVIGNYFGTDREGEKTVGNSYGIVIASGATGNQIGGFTPGESNLISGNAKSGVNIWGSGTRENIIIGNSIGVNSEASGPCGDQKYGIRIGTGAQKNTIGGEGSNEGNCISCNQLYGVYIENIDTDSNTVIGNWIGTDRTESKTLSNGDDGIRIAGGPSHNIIGPYNVIEHNQGDGIEINGPSTSNNTITMNDISSNQGKGILLAVFANNRIESPVILSVGSVSGTAPPYTRVEVFSDSVNEGQYYEGFTTADGNGNFYWESNPVGPYITATATDENGNTSEFSVPKILGGFIVHTTADTGVGSFRWAIDEANRTLGPDTIFFNILPNDQGFDGAVWRILLKTNLPSLSEGRTVIVGNSQEKNQGMTNEDGPEILLDGSLIMGYSSGLTITSSENEVSNIVIGGFQEGINIRGKQAKENRVWGNYIGTNATGSDQMGNGFGVFIGFEANQNIIGGDSEDQQNIISANYQSGILISGADNNTIIGNFIGTDRTGTLDLGNEKYGIMLTSGANNNMIGGLSSEEANVISWNGEYGIRIEFNETDSNQVVGNYIGTDLNGAVPMGNETGGISIYSNAQFNQIGPSNVICKNGGDGIVVTGNLTLFNRITQNVIYGNQGKGISLLFNANGAIAPPVINQVDPLKGTAIPGTLIEIYSDSLEEAARYEGYTEADEWGYFQFDKNLTGPYITTTATDKNGNTSELSLSKRLIGIVVNHTGDTGEGSLRWAIEESNVSVGKDTIFFNISTEDSCFDGTVWRIRPKSELPSLSSGGIMLLGESQAQLQGNYNFSGPEIVLDGSDLSGQSRGIIITSSENVVSTLIICGFREVGILITGHGAFQNWLKGNYIGTNESGTDSLGNGYGVTISSFAGNNKIGGSEWNQRNLISGNHVGGLNLNNTDSNLVINNFIGTDASGRIPLENNGCGIQVGAGSEFNVIGGVAEREFNVISSNSSHGIYIIGLGTNQNHILHNFIGTDSSGTQVLSNGYDGIRISISAMKNRVGPDNRIYYNLYDGVVVQGTSTLYNTITQNKISMNGGKGISLLGGGNGELAIPVIDEIGSVQGTAAADAIVEIFSDSLEEGRLYETTIPTDKNGHFFWEGIARGPYVTATVTDTSGNTSGFSLPKRLGDIVVVNTLDEGKGSLRWAIELANFVQGADTILFDIPQNDPGNEGTFWRINLKSNLPILSGGGTLIFGESQGQFQGGKSSGNPKIILDGFETGEEGKGLVLQSMNNTISGLIIAGFDDVGIELISNDATDNLICGNYIGVDSSGNASLANGDGIRLSNGAKNNIIGGNLGNERNTISGNIQCGIVISNADSCHVLGNLIGTNIFGDAKISNGLQGIEISGDSRGNWIGNTKSEKRNVISGNLHGGIELSGFGVTGNHVLGNYIGTDITGASSLSNGNQGVLIHNRAWANIIGGEEAGEGNVISANDGCGVTIFGEETDSNWVAGNRIGTNHLGLGELGNSGEGIFVHIQAKHNCIGPLNIIGGNQGSGIYLRDAGTDSNTIAGNWVGLDATGQDTIPNFRHGIEVGDDIRYTIVGGRDISDRNIVAGNRLSGIGISGDSTSYNLIQNNYLGTDTSGTQSLGNGQNGIDIGGLKNVLEGNLISGNQKCGVVFQGLSGISNVLRYNRIGVQAGSLNSLPNEETGIRLFGPTSFDTIGPGNQIWYNQGFGIELMDSLVQQITITQNSITGNDSGGIILREGANGGIAAPQIYEFSPPTGTVSPNSRIEIFSDSLDQGMIYEGFTLADEEGHWLWSPPLKGPSVTTTSTDTLGNTSAFSTGFVVSVDEKVQKEVVHKFFLSQNYPNPFNSVTMILFGVQKSCPVVLKVYNLLGREVATLINEIYPPGQHLIQFSATDLPTGIYFYRIQMGDYRTVRKMVILE